MHFGFDPGEIMLLIVSALFSVRILSKLGAELPAAVINLCSHNFNSKSIFWSVRGEGF